MKIPHRSETCRASDRSSDSASMQDVYRCRSFGRRFRLRRDRHPVSSRLEGSLTPAILSKGLSTMPIVRRSNRATAKESSVAASRSCISMKSTKCSVSIAFDLSRASCARATGGKTHCTTFAGSTVRRRLRVGLPHQRSRAARPLLRRLGRSSRPTASRHVFSERRHHPSRRFPSREKSSGAASTFGTKPCTWISDAAES